MWQFDRFNNAFIPGTLPAGDKITACYIRLSQEDEQEGESGSVLNQCDFLLKYCTDNRFQNVRFFSDDGYSGVNFRDVSKKIRAVFTNKGNSGQRLCTYAPYGYTGNKHGWELTWKPPQSCVRFSVSAFPAWDRCRLQRS